jgi:hypothetical protein
VSHAYPDEVNRFRVGSVAAVVVSLLASASACTQASPSARPTQTVTTTVTATATATATVTRRPTTATATPSPTQASTRECGTAGLRVTVSYGSGAAGTTSYRLVLTNTSSHPCRTGGFGGVSLVAGTRGTPIGAPAVRSEQARARSVTLQPGQQARATILLSNAGNYSTAYCRPAPAMGLRVYPPNQAQSVFVALPSTACRNPAVKLLTLTPLQPSQDGG